VRMTGKRAEHRSSALWGTGNRGGETRSNALWGKGGRGFVTALVAMLAISVPLAASSDGNGNSGRGNNNDNNKTYVSPVLRQMENGRGNPKVSVIITADPTLDTSLGQVKSLIARSGLGINKNLGLVNGFSIDLPVKKIDDLSKIQGLTITPDAAVHTSGYTSNQLWPYESGVSANWSGPRAPTPGPTAPTIAVIDSGIQADRGDFAGRVLASVNLSTMPNNTTPGDGRGHGTFVAGIAAGGASDYTGATPQANLVAVDVMNDEGVARTSDVIAGCQWVLANKARYNIKVANLSLHSATPSSFTTDPLDKAVEQLWFNGVTVVAAAGNYGLADKASGVLYAPGNDPFVITVGAIDIGGTNSRNDDFNAPWSAWGRTPDGFMKPDISAPGRYMAGPVPAGSTLVSQKPASVTAPGYIQLSGTSFAAPVIAGAAAQIIANNPTYTPDQVKGLLMVSAKPVPDATLGSVGVGEIQMSKAAVLKSAPNPNASLNRFLANDLVNGKSFNAVSWSDAVKASVSWDAVSWDSVSWADASWSAVSWADVSWAAVSWADVSWADVSWADSSYEDAAEGDGNQDGGYELTPEQAAEIMADPDIAPSPDELPADVSAALDDTGSTDGGGTP
jgi:serine protease AprX